MIFNNIKKNIWKNSSANHAEYLFIYVYFILKFREIKMSYWPQ